MVNAVDFNFPVNISSYSPLSSILSVFVACLICVGDNFVQIKLCTDNMKHGKPYYLIKRLV